MRHEHLTEIGQYQSFLNVFVKSSFSKKITKIWKNLPLDLTLLCKCQTKFSNFVAFSQFLYLKAFSAFDKISNKIEMKFFKCAYIT